VISPTGGKERMQFAPVLTALYAFLSVIVGGRYLIGVWRSNGVRLSVRWLVGVCIIGLAWPVVCWKVWQLRTE